jgi:hypothetical protein
MTFNFISLADLINLFDAHIKGPQLLRALFGTLHLSPLASSQIIIYAFSTATHRAAATMARIQGVFSW